MPTTYSKRLVIIDGKSVFYRGYYAMPNLATKDGTPTGGVYGFAVMAMEIVRKLKPDYVCVAWDKPKTNIRARKELYPEYKANRKPAPPDFYEQVPILHELLDTLGWPLYELDDYEADDIMGAFAKQAGARGIESYLVTSDLDVLQLVNEHTHIYTLKKGFSNIELFNVESFEAKYGVGAHQWIDVKALKGDSSDNIPGVAGVGEKTALELIKKYDTLEGVYEHLDELKPALQAKLERDRDMAFLSKKLVTLIVDLPLDMDFDKCLQPDGLTPELVQLFKRLEFRALLRQVEAHVPVEAVEAAEAPAEPIEKAARVPFRIQDFEKGETRIMQLANNHLLVSAKPGAYSALSLDGLAKDDFNSNLMAVQNGPVIGHDLKTCFRELLARNISIPAEVGHDTRIAAFLIDALQRSRELSDLAGQAIEPTDGGAVIAAIWKLYQEQTAQLVEAPKLRSLAHDMEFPMIPLLSRIEHRGIHLDSAALADMSQQFAVRIEEFEQKIYELAGQTFNIGSPSQLGTILFEKMGLPTLGIKRGKTGYSTGAKELDKLRGLHPIADLITTWREYTKLKGTYIDALPKLVDEHGKLHTTFALDVAATGRLSSHDPNLQNIPTRTELGQAIRRAFVPAPGHVFVSADYSQFELRLAAVLADDKQMIEDFNNDIDIHTATAAQVYGVPLEEVTKDMRRHAKTVNFGVLYGMSPHGLSVATGMTRDEAKAFIDAYFELRAPVRQYIDRTVAEALERGYVETIFGRRRPTPDLKSSNFVVREAAKRAAANMPIQGTEADLMKLAMLEVEQKLEGLGEQVLQIHDSILVEAPRANAQQVATVLRETMENIYKLPVKLKVDVSTGDNWGEL
ncbi:DNA polymerase I [Candidatus Saccharibacteria bacterium]|nr:DNA polymerase I [Candidatus Saccharibacteria bacterium]